MKRNVWVNLDDSIVDLSCLESELAKHDFSLTKKVIKDIDDPAFVELANAADAVISVGESWNKTTLDKLEKHPRIIIRYGVGYNNLNLEDLSARQIAGANIPGQNSTAVAEIALLHILNLGRRFSRGIELSKEGVWPNALTGQELDGKTLALIGFGHIARQLARLVSGFSVKVSAYDKYLDLEQARKDYPEIRFAENYEDLLPEADYVSLHLPLTAETEGIVNQAFLGKMKPSAYLINTCRGEIVNEEDLLSAVRQNQIAGAGLDVLSHEPPRKDHPLFSEDHVFITGHLGAGSLESEIRSQKKLAETISDYFKGELGSNILNKASLMK